MKLWQNHGTKIIGGAVTVLGTVAAVDPALVTALGPKAQAVAVIAGGLLTILRGIQNTKKQEQQS